MLFDGLLLHPCSERIIEVVSVCGGLWVVHRLLVPPVRPFVCWLLGLAETLVVLGCRAAAFVSLNALVFHSVESVVCRGDRPSVFQATCQLVIFTDELVDLRFDHIVLVVKHFDVCLERL